MNKVVVRKLDGEVLKGFTGDFSSTRTEFLLTTKEDSLSINQNVYVNELKAIYFVKSFEGDFLRNKLDFIETGLPPKKGYGQRIIVSFADGEEFFGRVEALHTSKDHIGFFIYPLDTTSNIIRAFFLNKAIVGIQHIDS